MNDQELWAIACLLLRQEGEDVRLYLADRVGELAAKGDREGVEKWNTIADRVDALQEAALAEKH